MLHNRVSSLLPNGKSINRYTNSIFTHQYHNFHQSSSTRKFLQTSIISSSHSSTRYQTILNLSRYKSATAKSTKTSYKGWTLSHKHRVMLHQLGYWSPRAVIAIWGISFVVTGLYLLKKGIDTDGFSTQLQEGTFMLIVISIVPPKLLYLSLSVMNRRGRGYC